MAETLFQLAMKGASPSDDAVLPFQTSDPGIRGRLARLGPCVDTILKRHKYPDAVSEVLAEAIVLTAMLGVSVPPGGKLSLQARTDGAISFLFIDFEAEGLMRATASFNAARVAELSKAGDGSLQSNLLGTGHLALTLEPGEGLDRTQGIAALDGGTLTAAAQAYFRQSEQLPTYIRLAVAKHYVAGASAGGPAWSWRAGGLIVQHLHQPLETEDQAEADDWNSVRVLAATVEDHELLDPALAPDRLLFRLFQEEGVRAFPAKPLAVHCRCSREKVESFLKSFGREQLADMHDAEGKVSVTCEFCSTAYRFDPENLG
jgi:molecular chaperone Hsp33